MISVQYIIPTSTHTDTEEHRCVLTIFIYESFRIGVFFSVHHQKGRAFPSIFRVSLVPDKIYFQIKIFESNVLEDPLYVLDEMLPNPAATKGEMYDGTFEPCT